jgi:Zn-dependent protease
MQSGWRVGSLFGIPLFIDPSWFFVLVLVAVPRGMLWNLRYPEWGATTAYTIGALMALLLFVSVVLHELGHSLVARSQGIKVNSITLFLFGGIASIDRESRTPGGAFQVAIAGPAVSFALFGLLSLATYAIPNPNSPLNVLATNLAVINLVLALFNLIPGLPLDGGQILKALIWKITGDRFKGIHWAASVGKTLGWMAVLLGMLAVLRGDTGGIWIALLGWFAVQNASNYDRLTDLQEALLQIKASDAMTREFRVVDADMSLRQFADTYLLDTARLQVFFAASDGRYRGLVAPDEIRFIERSEWETSTLYRLIHPLTEIPTVQETTPIVEVIQLLEAKSMRRVTVLSPAGAVAGVIDRGDIVRALAQKMNLQVSSQLIQQIKDQGSYPPGLNLASIAEAAAEAVVPASR